MRKKVFQKTLTLKNTDLPTSEAKLDNQVKKKTLLKIKDQILNASHNQRITSTATTLIRKTYSKLLTINPLNKTEKFGFRRQFKEFFSPSNLVALLLMDVGIAFLVCVGNLLWIDVTHWQKDVITALFPSRTGEAISGIETFSFGIDIIGSG